MVPARVVLYMLSFSGFVVSFMMRMDINLAMVSMVKYHDASNVSIASSCYNVTAKAMEEENSQVNRSSIRYRFIIWLCR